MSDRINFCAVVISATVGVALLFTGCERSSRIHSIPASHEEQEAELGRVEAAIQQNPADGALHARRLTLLLAGPDLPDSARRLWSDLAKVQGGDRFLCSLLDHPIAIVRVHAARLSGESSLKAAIPGLRRRAQERDPEVRRTATAALRKLHDDGAFFIFALLLKDSSWAVRAEATQAIAMFPTSDTVSRLMHSAQDEDGFVRYCAAEALASLGCDATRGSFQKFASKTDAPVQRQLAGLALARIGDGSGLAIAEEVLRDRDNDFRTIAAECLATGDPKRAAELFRDLLHEGESNEQVRTVILERLGRLPPVEEKEKAVGIHPPVLP